MATSFLFYDLETSGINPREARIMQFAGQRTDMDLQPVGEPFNIIIKLTPDVLPEPDAILLTGITPQQTLVEGISEVEFLKIFETEIATPDTILLGFNSVRFDDEFVRYTRYRNFYDPYDWHWKNGRSRWDLLDLVRMTRALRPDGIEWPFTPDGKPTNRLELLTSLNGLDHSQAHDALSDVMATIAVAKLIKDKQPKLFSFLLGMREKKQVKALVEAGQPFIYTSGKYGNDHEKTAVVYRVADDIGKQGSLVYDLHYDPDEYARLSPKELVEIWKRQKDPEAKRLPIKTIKYNRCPAVAPLSVLDAASQNRIKLDTKIMQANLAKLKAAVDFPAKLRAAQAMMEKQRQMEFVGSNQSVDAQLYDEFLDTHDNDLLRVVRAAAADEIEKVSQDFHDRRMQMLLPLYKARNFPEALSSEEREVWDAFCTNKLFAGGDSSRLAKYFERLGQCAELPQYKDKQFLLEELQLYGQSLLPAEF